MTSSIGGLTKAIAADLATMAEMPVANVPQVWWVPEFERDELQKIEGVHAAVFPFAHDPELASRGGGSLGNEIQSVHVAVMKSRDRTANTPAEQFTDGDGAVELAELIATRLSGLQLTDAAGVLWRCVNVEHDPVISGDYARDYRMWVSYVKSDWISG